jgi:hypothetical protein
VTRQFERLHEELKGGGFSEHIPTETRPQAPGFMVSDFGTEDKRPSHLTSPQLLEAFARVQGLTQAPMGEFMGGWPEEGEDYLDVSRQYPDVERGKIAMILQNQRAMYDLSKSFDDPEAYIRNPGYDPKYDTKEHERRMDAGEPVIPTWLRPARTQQYQVRRAVR